MSGVNYANSSVHKSDLQLVENYAVSLSGGGGGGGAQHEYAYTASTSDIAVTTSDTTASLGTVNNFSSKFSLVSGTTLVYTGGTKTFSVNLSGTFAPADPNTATNLFIRVNVKTGISNATIPGSSCTVVTGGTTMPFNPAVTNFDSVSVATLQNGDEITVKMATGGNSGNLKATTQTVALIAYAVPSLRLLLREIK